MVIPNVGSSFARCPYLPTPFVNAWYLYAPLLIEVTTYPTSRAAADPESERDPLRNPCPASRLAVSTAFGWSLSMVWWLNGVGAKGMREDAKSFGDME